MWAGVDVGGRRKGFDVAVFDGAELQAPRRFASPIEVLQLLRQVQPRVVAIDSPRSPAPDGSKSRDGERALACDICGIRYTPDREALASNPSYYDWIQHGFELYRMIELEFQVIECFPTASWTRWHGPRGAQTRAAWTRVALASLEVGGVPKRTNQDVRDAIAAAVTARAHDDGVSESYGDIVVPLARRVIPRACRARGGASAAPRARP